MTSRANRWIAVPSCDGVVIITMADPAWHVFCFNIGRHMTTVVGKRAKLAFDIYLPLSRLSAWAAVFDSWLPSTIDYEPPEQRCPVSITCRKCREFVVSCRKCRKLS